MLWRFIAGQNDAGINMLLIKIPIEIGGGEPNLHVGVASLKIMEPRDQPFQGDREINLNGEFIVVRRRFQRAGLRFNLVKGVANGGIVDVPGLGEFGAPGIPAEELDAQSLFQCFHLVAYGGAGNAEFTGCKPETAEPGGGFKSG